MGKLTCKVLAHAQKHAIQCWSIRLLLLGGACRHLLFWRWLCRCLCFRSLTRRDIERDFVQTRRNSARTVIKLRQFRILFLALTRILFLVICGSAATAMLPSTLQAHKLICEKFRIVSRDFVQEISNVIMPSLQRDPPFFHSLFIFARNQDATHCFRHIKELPWSKIVTV